MAMKGMNVKLYMELYKRCPKNQLRQLKKVESKHRVYVEKINSLPEGLPKIDWEFYRNKVRPEYADMVKEFESKYTEFKVPKPKENVSKEVEEERKEVEKTVGDYIAESCERINELETRINEVNAKIPFEEMTMEEYIDNYPEIAPNFLCNPTFWPHLPNEQEIGAPKGATSDH